MARDDERGAGPVGGDGPVGGREPVTELDARYSAPGAAPTPWPEARALLAAAEISWLSTVRPDGRPHVTPLLTVWLDDALHFTTGPHERKAHNLTANAHCVLTTGGNALLTGLDLVVEGIARLVRDDAELRRIADAFEAKYSAAWHFDVADGTLRHEGVTSVAYRVAPVTAFGFRKGEYAQTRWRFAPARA
ncbi:pyridoxamine 5'-phosphate oxidase family protein [Streptomyces avicenniae]|uniref:pyridoxamine 5'-phosphate oxidase family protein n=1 Tax=Streptomyces avicenniae TaxID=500153 RepID=UPI000AAE9AD0|nr:pyridoxamine 5'-phosphate oxidase family protein [Streptomyces avicenniae]